MTASVGVLFPGDMGAALVRRLTAHGHRVVSCLEGRSPRTRDAAGATGVVALPSLADVAVQADLVLSVVPQEAAPAVARDFSAAAQEAAVRSLYVDCNSLAPASMVEIAGVLAVTGCDCVDGAFVGSAAALGGKTTLCLSGPRAPEAARLLGDALPVRVLGGEVGLASAFKLSVYGFNKGLVALYLEMVTAADRLGLRDELIGTLRDFYPGSVETAERLLPTYPRHAPRRIDELSEVIGWLGALGQSAGMATATRAVIEEIAALGVPAENGWDAAALLDELCGRGLLRRDALPPDGGD